MADVRALLAAERASRRITHPHLSYSKSGVLSCNICNLNVKSESLWEGHLRSANHRKNAAAQAAQESTPGPKKRKIDDVDESLEREDDENGNGDTAAGDNLEGRKKVRSRTESLMDGRPAIAVAGETGQLEENTQNGTLGAGISAPATSLEATTSTLSTAPNTEAAVPTQAPRLPAVDEDEWAAFERDVAPLAQADSKAQFSQIPQKQPDYSTATISAAPVSAAQIAEQAAETEKRRRQHEVEAAAEDEKEEEERRMEDELDVMEEMEERVRKLTEKREALRLGTSTRVVDIDTGQDEATLVADGETTVPAVNGQDEEEDEDEDDVDDWYS